MGTDDNKQGDKQARLLAEIGKVLEAGRKAGASWEVLVRIVLHEGGVRHAHVGIERKITL